MELIRFASLAVVVLLLLGSGTPNFLVHLAHHLEPAL
uniref:Uncharacterized protein n=1 Tax=Phakopsora pachyrhizi TaxID=170000 RepID=A0A0S1MKY7_PHAPC